MAMATEEGIQEGNKKTDNGCTRPGPKNAIHPGSELRNEYMAYVQELQLVQHYPCTPVYIFESGEFLSFIY